MNAIFCELNHCIYNKKGECRLQSITVSPVGVCEDCMLPDISDSVLQKLKQKMHKQLAQSAKNK